MSVFFWWAISIFVCWDSLRLNIGNIRSPGPGLLPFWAGVILFGLATILWVMGVITKNRGEKLGNLWKGRKTNKVATILICLFAYVLLLPQIGFVIATFGLMVFLFRVIGGTRLWIQVVSALITVSIAYLIFLVCLGIPLPKGVLGF